MDDAAKVSYMTKAVEEAADVVKEPELMDPDLIQAVDWARGRTGSGAGPGASPSGWTYHTVCSKPGLGRGADAVSALAEPHAQRIEPELHFPLDGSQ